MGAQIQRRSDNTVPHDNWQAYFSLPEPMCQKYYLIRILDQLGLLISPDYLVGAFQKYKLPNDLLEDAAQELLGLGVSSYINASDYYKKNKTLSVASSILDLQNRPSEVFSKLYSALSFNGDIIRASEKLNIADFRAYCVNEQLSEQLDNMQSVIVYALSRLADECWARACRETMFMGSISETVNEDINTLLTCIRKALEHPYYEFLYVTYYLCLQRRLWALESLYNWENFSKFVLDEVQWHIRCAIEICAPKECIKTYRCLQRIYEQNYRTVCVPGSLNYADRYRVLADALEAEIVWRC